MKKFNGFIILFLIGFMLLCPNKKILACMGTPCPDCCRTVWLAKFTPTTVLFPSTGVSITVPISMLPFASWITSATLGCPAPISASLSVTLTCTPALGGPTTTIGPMMFTAPTVATPVAPGVQPLITVPFTIPAGTFSTVTPQVCTVMGIYTVTFADGTSVSGTGDTKVCLVPPSVADPSIPELNVEYVKINGEDFITCKKGDQATLFYLIENNDPDRSVSLTVSSTTNQVAKMPVSDPPDDPSLFSLADPVNGTDSFPLQFFSDSGNPGELIDLPDPTENSNREITKDITIPPKGITVVSIDIRTWGMCANGSCSDNLTIFQGEWSDGEPALGCAGTALVVGDVPAKSALCDIEDVVKSSPNADVDWSAAEFGDANGPFIAASTFFNGQLTSQNIENVPQRATDSIRTDSPATETWWSANASVNFPESGIIAQNAVMTVDITGLAPELPCALPVIGFGNGPSNIKADIDMGLDQIVIQDMSNAQSVILNQDIFSDIDGDGEGDPNGDSFPKDAEINLNDIKDAEFGEFLFIVGPAPDCPCTHLHGIIFIGDLGPFFDPDPDGCGFGCVGASTTGGPEIFNGSFSGFLENPPAGFNIDPDTCRTTTLSCPPPPDDLSVIALDPPAFARTLNLNDDNGVSDDIDIDVLNSRNQQKIGWNASSTDPSIMLRSPSGGAGTDLIFGIDLTQIAEFPVTTRSYIEITSDNAIRGLNLPIFARTGIIKAEICNNGIDDDDDGLIDKDDPDCRRFIFSCNNDFLKGPVFDLERLVMELGEDETCVLKLTRLEPDTPVEIHTDMKSVFKSSVEVVPMKGVTDENGELEVTISAIGEGINWIAFAVANEEGKFEFSKEAYDKGYAWGFFVQVQ